MEIWAIYLVVALSISLTSYWNIYRPALDLYKEITEEDSPVVGTVIYKIIWVILAFIMAPFIAIMLVKGRNDNYIRDLVIAWIGTDE